MNAPQRIGPAGKGQVVLVLQGGGALFALSKLIRNGGRFNIERRHVRIEPSIIGRLIKLSATGTFQVFIGMASWIGLVRIISSFGSNAVAGYTIGIRLIIFALLPSWGLSNAAATMVGQALGQLRHLLAHLLLAGVRAARSRLPLVATFLDDLGAVALGGAPDRVGEGAVAVVDAIDQHPAHPLLADQPLPERVRFHGTGGDRVEHVRPAVSRAQAIVLRPDVEDHRVLHLRQV